MKDHQPIIWRASLFGTGAACLVVLVWVTLSGSAGPIGAFFLMALVLLVNTLIGLPIAWIAFQRSRKKGTSPSRISAVILAILLSQGILLTIFTIPAALAGDPKIILSFIYFLYTRGGVPFPIAAAVSASITAYLLAKQRQEEQEPN